MEATLSIAITERIVVQFYYEGHLRIVEPFTLGRLKNGKLALCAYRIGGYSKSNEMPPWRLFHLSGISRLQLTDLIAESNRNGYNRRDPRMSRIICTI